MEVYINGLLAKANVLSSTTSVKDETLDTFSFFLVNDQPQPYAPMQYVRIVDDGGVPTDYVLTSDSVEPFTLQSGLYKHNVSCTENIRILSKYLIRNSVFTQPANPYRKTAFRRAWSETNLTLSGYDDWSYTYGTLNMSGTLALTDPEKLTLGPREKHGRVYFELRLQVAVARAGEFKNPRFTARSHNDLHTLDEINALLTDQSTHFSTYADPILHYTLNGTQHNEVFTIPGGLRFNQKVEVPQIEELLDSGATDIFVDLDGNTLLSQTMKPRDGTHIPFYSLQMELTTEVFYYSAYDILDLLLKRFEKYHLVDNQVAKRELPFKLPESGELKDLLNKTIAPNFAFTQCTLFEAVAEVFRLFDAIFTMDASQYLGISYFNDQNGQRVTPKITSTNSAIGEERYANGLVSYYQDARVTEEFPSKGSYARMRSTEIGVPSSDGSKVFMTPHSIQSIKGVTALVTLNAGALLQPSPAALYAFIEVENYPLDITHNVVEKSIWSGYLPTDDAISYADPYAQKQNNTIYFQEGDDKIDLAYSYTASWGTTYYSFGLLLTSATMRQLGLVSSSNNDFITTLHPTGTGNDPINTTPEWDQVKLQVSYLTSVDGRLKVESTTRKFDGDIIIDQSNGAVDLNKLGLNMLGLSYRMGEPMLSVSHKVTNWANRIRKGDTIEYDGAIWTANSCNYTDLGNGYYQGRISFVKNYNELSLRKQLLREKRFSNVASNLTMKSEDDLVEYCYFSTASAPATQPTIFDHASFRDCLSLSFGGPSQGLKSLDYAIFDGSNNARIYIPMIRYGAGNMVCFEMSFDAPMNAGIQTKVSASGWWGLNKYHSSYVIYTDQLGFADRTTIRIAKDSKRDFDDNFPIVGSTDSAALIQDYLVYKQPNEIFALNYEIAFLPVDARTDFIGTAFINDNFFVDNEIKTKDLWLYYSTGYKYSVLDTEGHGERTPVSCSVGNSVDYTELIFSHLPVDCDAWAICDGHGKILFASNNANQPINEKRVYFALRRERL